MTDLPCGLFRAEQVRELDRLAIEEFDVPGYTLMTRAAAAALRELRRCWPHARRLVVLCGTGNNGGDGYVLARLAVEAGLTARVLTLGDQQALIGDAATARNDWMNSGGHAVAFAPDGLDDADVVVDGLLGTGLQRELSGQWREAVEAVNAHAAPVLALDIPSGLHADTGAVLGAAVYSALTVSFIGLKRGLFTGEGPDRCGEVVFDDLGVPAGVYLSVPPAATRIEGDVLRRLLPPRPRGAHKGRFGHVLVVGGDHGMTGAVRMAAEAAARGGAGLVSVATRREHAAAIAAVRPELMCHGVDAAADLHPLLERATVVAIGPGLGQSPWAQRLLGTVLDTDLPLVVDADALNLLAREPGSRGHWVLTPHPGEAARLLGTSAAEVQADRFAAVEALADAFDGVVVLKGAGTLVHARGGGTYLCDRGNPGMASGGMGDVLTGVIASLLAQGLDLEDAARAGVFAHAMAADVAAGGGERGLMALDLLPELRQLLNPAQRECGRG